MAFQAPKIAGRCGYLLQKIKKRLLMCRRWFYDIIWACQCAYTGYQPSLLFTERVGFLFIHLIT
jgi:hypothetical protein